MRGSRPMVDAMLQPKHVRCLVGEHLTTAVQQDCLVISCALLAIKSRIVSREAEDGDPLPQRGLPENEVPRRLRIQILHRDRQNAERRTHRAAAYLRGIATRR